MTSRPGNVFLCHLLQTESEWLDDPKINQTCAWSYPLSISCGSPGDVELTTLGLGQHLVDPINEIQKAEIIPKLSIKSMECTVHAASRSVVVIIHYVRSYISVCRPSVK